MRRRCATLGFMLLLGFACAHQQGVKPSEPVVVQSLSLTFGEEGEGHLDLVLEMDNTGGRTGVIHSMSCDVFLNHRWFVASEGLLNLPLPAASKVLIPIHIPWMLRRAVVTAGQADDVDVEVRGRVDFNRGGGPEQLTFERKSRMHVENAPRPGDDPL